jgi:hypothetical protein
MRKWFGWLFMNLFRGGYHGNHARREPQTILKKTGDAHVWDTIKVVRASGVGVNTIELVVPPIVG